MRHFRFLSFLITIVLLSACRNNEPTKSENIELANAKATLGSIYAYYGATNTQLLRENYPFDTTYVATYLASEANTSAPNAFSFLWPYSGTFSAITAIMHIDSAAANKKILDDKVLIGLEEYFDTQRSPSAYASYINAAPASDRFYDDNVWLGIDFCDAYNITKEQKYLDKAKLIWKFIESGIDDKLGGGIYWCEQKKESKNTCSNAPGSVYALKLFQATGDSTYFKQGKSLYQWTKLHLQDTTDYLYFDNQALDGNIGKAKYAYNSGQMMQAATLLYNITQDKAYLTDAQHLAKACHLYFFQDFTTPDGKQMRLLKKGNIWFTAVMFRGFVELFNADKNAIYVDDFRQNLAYAWTHARDEHGLFETDWSGTEKDPQKWLLTQAAMVEMYARMASVK